MIKSCSPWWWEPGNIGYRYYHDYKRPVKRHIVWNLRVLVTTLSNMDAIFFPTTKVKLLGLLSPRAPTPLGWISPMVSLTMLTHCAVSIEECCHLRTESMLGPQIIALKKLDCFLTWLWLGLTADRFHLGWHPTGVMTSKCRHSFLLDYRSPPTQFLIPFLA